ncbi:hypothetical protein A2U01_0106507 [Trifolium medium]|uniref:Uncharacterized protein n=1 Tax=Trifolium medium TaxID=97028 RepID=A0A392VA67_9FABA|nr:hypothetical protein [Trifolium medium]
MSKAVASAALTSSAPARFQAAAANTAAVFIPDDRAKPPSSVHGNRRVAVHFGPPRVGLSPPRFLL